MTLFNVNPKLEKMEFSSIVLSFVNFMKYIKKESDCFNLLSVNWNSG